MLYPQIDRRQDAQHTFRVSAFGFGEKSEARASLSKGVVFVFMNMFRKRVFSSAGAPPFLFLLFSVIFLLAPLATEGVASSPPSRTTPETIYVKSADLGGNDGSNGLDWDNAFATFSKALTYAKVSGDVVRVAKGTYETEYRNYGFCCVPLGGFLLRRLPGERGGPRRSATPRRTRRSCSPPPIQPPE